jgi:mRNA-degrading endonuclease toxin of MazEF toxin-antitoxin module
VSEFPTEIPVRNSDIEGVILSDHVRSLDWRAREARKITTAGQNITQEAIATLRLLIT